MSKEQIRFVSLGIKSYGRIDKGYKPNVKYPEGVEQQIQDLLKNIDPDGGLFFVFPEGYRVAILEGEEKTGKTSVITCLKEAAGNIAEPDFAVNTEDNDKSFNEKFWGKDGCLYEIRGTRKTFVLEKIETDEEGKPVLNEKGKLRKSEIRSPKDMIKKLAGPAGVDPTTLKNMDGEAQITWMRSQYALTQEQLNLEAENARKRKEAYDSRTKANNKYKELSTLVNTNTEFKVQTWEESEKYFAETKFDDVEEKIKDIQDKYQKYLVYEKGTEQLKFSRDANDVLLTAQQDEIAALEEKLRLAKEKLSEIILQKDMLTTRIADREKWQEENKGIIKQNEDISEQVRQATEFKAAKQRFEIWKENKRNMDHYSNESIRLTALVDGYDAWKQDFIKSFTPQVPGLEICIPDDTEKRHGLIYNGKESRYWSESEAWEVGSQMWEQLGTRMIFVENISSLGSGAIEKFNDFVNNGGYIFGSLMNRKEKNLKVTITNQLPQ